MTLLSQKWILELDEDSINFNQKKKHLIMRLQQATMEMELLEKARVEEIYNEEFDSYQNGVNLIIKEALKEKQEALKEKQEAMMREKEALRREQELIMREQEALMREQVNLEITAALRKEIEELKKSMKK